MKEVPGPVVAIALILSAVFIPVAFMRGHHGPAVPAVRAHDRRLGAHLGVQRADALARRSRRCCCKPRARRAGLLGRFFAAFNRVFERATDGYVGMDRRR